jgi:hypothetical protein
VLRALDVIWIDDDLISPPGPKMVVCVAPALGLFVRINTRGHWPGSVALAQRLHPFLKHDSFLECGAVFELDDYMIGQSFASGRGVIGRIDRAVVPDLLAAVRSARTLSARDREAIVAALTVG